MVRYGMVRYGIDLSGIARKHGKGMGNGRAWAPRDHVVRILIGTVVISPKVLLLALFASCPARSVTVVG